MNKFFIVIFLVNFKSVFLGEYALLLFITYKNRIFTNQNYFMMKRITLLLLLIYTTLASSQVKVYNTEVKYKKTPNLSVVDSILTKDNNDLLSATSVADFTTQIGLDNYLQNIVEDTSPQLGGSLDINFQNINGNGNIDFTGYLKNNGDVTFSAYPQSRDDGTASNFLFTDSNGKIQSTQLTQLDSKYLQLTGGTITNNLTIDGLSILDDLRFVKSGVINYIQSGNERVASSWNDIIFSPYGTTSNPKFRIGETINTSYNDFTAPKFIGDGSQLTGVNAVSLDGKQASYFMPAQNEFNASDASATWSDGVKGISLIANTTGSVNFPYDFGFAAHFKNDQGENNSSYARTFTLWKRYAFDELYFQGYNSNGEANGFKKIFHEGNFGKTQIDALGVDAITLNGNTDYARESVSNTFSQLQTINQTIAQIDAAPDKTVPTKEWVQANSGGLPVGFYEEGTFSPTISATGATFTVGVVSGRYIRTGNLVWVDIILSAINQSGTPTSATFINNLPFAFDLIGGGAEFGFNIHTMTGTSLSDIDVALMHAIESSGGNNRIGFIKSNDVALTNNLQIGTNGGIRITGTYITNVYTP